MNKFVGTQLPLLWGICFYMFNHYACRGSMIRRLIWNGMGPMLVVHACKFRQLRGEGNKDLELKASFGYIAM